MRTKYVVIKSSIVEYRGNSWYFENPKERVYFKATNPTDAEVAEAMAFANQQYEDMGWMRCFVSAPQVCVSYI